MEMEQLWSSKRNGQEVEAGCGGKKAPPGPLPAYGPLVQSVEALPLEVRKKSLGPVWVFLFPQTVVLGNHSFKNGSHLIL